MCTPLHVGLNLAHADFIILMQTWESDDNIILSRKFAMSDQTAGDTASLAPESSIFNSKIEQLTPEESKHNIIAAGKETASMQQGLWLPRNLRQSLQRFAAEIINTK
ncbi:hypothetical protein VP01_1913g4 [Puccinia sorghi]|uniref:Uncharacterized protein n=1 Tax=Puccinia sorghi TaxID=27349 RepID=A0A0L6VD96_9BASI|nr:hypothetical protein VP01_1913g4 [Puccinia sorghi]